MHALALLFGESSRGLLLELFGEAQSLLRVRAKRVTRHPRGSRFREPKVSHAAEVGVLDPFAGRERVEIVAEHAEERQCLGELAVSVVVTDALEVLTVGDAPPRCLRGKRSEGESEGEPGMPHWSYCAEPTSAKLVSVHFEPIVPFSCKEG